MPRPTPAVRAAFVACLVAPTIAAVAACGHRRERRDAAEQRAQVDSLARRAAQMAQESSPVERARIDNRVGLPRIAGVASGAAGDSVRITSTDGAVVYTLARDTVRMQLGDSVVRAVRKNIAGADSASGNFGNFIKQTVAGAVGSAMSFVMKTPVRDIRTARYENGELRLESDGGPLHHGTFSVGHKRDGKNHTTFAPADAERFIAAIEARQRALGVREAAR